MTGIIQAIQTIVREELKGIHLMDLGIITSVFPHSSDGDKENYECNVRIRDKDVELRKVPIATQHIGLSNILHTGDLVLVSFINGDVNSPVIMGRLYNDEDRPPLSKMEEIVYKPQYTKNNNLRRLNIVLPEEIFNLNFFDDRMSIVIDKSSIFVNDTGEISIISIKNQQTNSGTELLLDNDSMQGETRNGDNTSVIKMENTGYMEASTNSGNKICKITMTDTGIQIFADQDIFIDSSANIRIKSDGDFSLQAKNIKIQSDGETKIKSGTSLQAESTSSLSIKSNATARIQSAAPMDIKGAIVKINS